MINSTGIEVQEAIVNNNNEETQYIDFYSEENWELSTLQRNLMSFYTLQGIYQTLIILRMKSEGKLPFEQSHFFHET